MVEITWGKAFGYGIRYILYVIVWAIIGGLIAVAGGVMIGTSVNLVYDPNTQQWSTTGMNWGGLSAGIIVIIIGEIIVIIGAISSYFKLMSKLISETVPAAHQPPPP